MAITSSDIKLMQSERLTEDSDGGGQMTGLPVIDGDINNLFEDISRIDRTYGDVSLRKTFLKVDTATADLYLDAHAILSAQPADPKVTGLLFTTEDFYDERASARQRIESFVIKGPQLYFHLRGTQLSGQKTIICYLSTLSNLKAPEPGDTFLLEIGENPETQQFIKVVNVITTSETFIYFNSDGEPGSFTARQFVMELSSELRRDYPAQDPHPAPNNQTKIYSTQSSSSAKYYGTTNLAAPATSGTTSILVNDTFAAIIPTASTETAIIDQRPGGYVSQIVPSGADDIAINVNIANGATSTLPSSIVPGSISFAVGGATYTDKAGAFVDDALTPGQLDGSTVNYATGVVTWASSISANNVSFNYRPGATRDQVPNTGKIAIEDSNRSFNYVLGLDPFPSPLTFNASYQYLGKWYEVFDDGTGLLVGDGSGQINYNTGSVILTLLAQPDSGSVLFYRWTEPQMYTQAADVAYAGNPGVTLQLTHGQVLPGTVTIQWVVGGVSKSATDTGGTGAISGDATGTINYANGRISLISSTVPDTNWQVNYTRKNEGILSAVNAVPNNATRANISLSTAANIQPGSVSFTLRKSFRREVYNESNLLIGSNYTHQSYEIIDNGSGQLVDMRRLVQVGTINYASGNITVVGTNFLQAYSYKQAVRLTQATVGAETVNKANFLEIAITEEIVAHNATVEYQLAAGAESAESQSIAATSPPWRFSLVPRGPITPGSTVLQIDGQLWFDNGAGVLWRNYNTTNGVGLAAGSIDYTTGRVIINYYAGRPTTAVVNTLACLVGDEWAPIKSASFRTVGAPLRPNGFTVRANNFETDALINGAADVEGDISGDGITGKVDLQDGVTDIVFPVPVISSTLFYNSVSYKQIPLDPEILGLDPVRLPSDGRVPILRDADILVITHTQKDLVNAPAAGLVVDAGRDRLHDAWFEDSLGTRLDPAQYVLNKETGIATLATPFVAQDAESNALVGDLFYVHRIDDMALCTEARIDGTLQLAQPLYHDFPAGETWVASAVYLGNLRARVKDWASYVSDPGYDGTGVTNNAQYNLIAYPIAIDNRGSVPDRWKIVFSSTTAFSLFSENRGLVGTGSTAADFSPTNAQTGTPYFTIKTEGWGAGWQTGNTVRFDTDAAAAPLWLIRTVLPGQATVDDDQLNIELRGDHN